MRNALIAATIIAGLVGCSPAEWRAKDQVRKMLNDPDSAQWRRLSASDGMVCGQVNAKNAFGGYVGYRSFMVKDGELFMSNDEETASQIGSCCIALQGSRGLPGDSYFTPARAQERCAGLEPAL